MNNYYWRDQLVKRDHKLFIRYETCRYSEPIKDVLYWPVSHASAFVGETFPLPARDAGNGSYTVRRNPDLDKSDCGYDAHFTVYFPNGGATKAEFVETSEIPCPKVRKGIETRYHNGRWEKYTKQGGWIAA
jgi:hypothetical protein